MNSKTYPLFMHNLHERLCVVVGGGQVATRKVLGLVDVGVVPRVISPELSSVLKQLSQDKKIDYVARNYQYGDLLGAFLVFGCSNDTDVNEGVLDEARARSIFINHTEDAKQSDFSTPATIRQGSLLLTVSSEGKSPSLTRYIKETLEQKYNEHYALLTDLLADAREDLKVLSASKRRQVLSEITSDSFLNQLTLNKQEAEKELLALLSN